MNIRRYEVLVACQQALLGEVSPQLRAVIVSFGETNIHVRCFFDGEISEEDRESMECFETELIALFPDFHHITKKVLRLDFPSPIPKEDTWIYFRKEGDNYV